MFQGSAMLAIIFCVSANFQCSFDSPQAKPNFMTITRNFLYMLPGKLLNDLRLKILSYQEISEKCQNFLESSVQSSFQTHNFDGNGQELGKIRYQCFLNLFNLFPFLTLVEIVSTALQLSKTTLSVHFSKKDGSQFGKVQGFC